MKSRLAEISIALASQGVKHEIVIASADHDAELLGLATKIFVGKPARDRENLKLKLVELMHKTFSKSDREFRGLRLSSTPDGFVISIEEWVVTNTPASGDGHMIRHRFMLVGDSGVFKSVKALPIFGN